MFKYIALIIVILISSAFYEQYSFSLLTEKQKQTLLDEELLIEKKKIADAEKRLLEINALKNTPWSELKKEQYLNKLIHSKIYIWFFVLLVPIILFYSLKLFNDKKHNG
jgi:hypothetical protein